MNYNLAKQLKEAGFPQSHAVSLFKHEEAVTIPTLSELIEACGSWRSLEQLPDKEPNLFLAKSWSGASSEGYSSEEAVANLWLELNKK